MTKYDVAVIGGGIAGLTAAIYAAKAGKRTIVLEQQKQFGGRAMTKKKNGIYFDVGGHALYFGEAFETFQDLGLTLSGSTPINDGYGLWKNQLVTIPMNLTSLIQSPLLSWKGKLEFAKWFAKLGTVNTSQWNHISTRNWVENQLSDPMLRNLFYALLRTAGYLHAPDIQAAGPTLKQLQKALKGVFYVDKGWGTIVEQLEKLAIQVGVKLVCDQKIATIEHQQQQVQSILTSNGQRIEAANVILTTSPTIAHRLVSHAEQTALETWKNQAIPITVAALDVGLRTLPNPDAQLIYGIDQPIFYSEQTRKGKPQTAILSDHGEHKIALFKYQGEQTDPKTDLQQLEHVLDLAQPGWRKELVSQQFLPKITVVYDFPHLKRTVLPGPAVPEINGLYVAGDWVSHGELLVDASVASAKRAVHDLSQRQQHIA